MSTCIDNPNLGRIGCGATYSGELQHAVAVVDRDIESSKELTRAEAAKVIDALEAATAAVA